MALIQVRRGSEGVIQVSQEAYDTIYKPAGFTVVSSAPASAAPSSTTPTMPSTAAANPATSTSQPAAPTVKPNPLPEVKRATVYHPGGSSNVVPEGDVSYWLSQGWSTTPPVATSTPAPAPAAASTGKPFVQAARATLVSPTGQRVAVEIGSKAEKDYFAQGYKLEGAGQAPFVPVTMINPATSERKAARSQAELTALRTAGFTVPETKLSVPNAKPSVDSVTDGKSANEFINRNQPSDQASAAQKEAPATRGNADTGTPIIIPTPADTAMTTENLDSIRKSVGVEPQDPSQYEVKYRAGRTEFGIDTLESSLVDLDAQIQDIYAIRRQRVAQEQNKPIPVGVISGRVSEIERQENERIDALNREKQTIVNELNMKYTTVNNLLKYYGLDYEAGVSRYNTAFNQTITAINTLKGIDDANKSEKDKQADNARANAQIIYNAALAGGVDISKLSATDKANISKLELQSGLPVGFFQSLQNKNPKNEVISSSVTDTADGKYAVVLLKGDDGIPTLKRYYIGPSTESAAKLSPAQIIDIFKSFENPEEALQYFKEAASGKSAVDTSGQTVADRLNNPGNIKWGDFARSQGGTDSGVKASDGGTFARFPDKTAGEKAQRSLLQASSYADLTVDAAMRRWSNGGYGGEIVSGSVDPNKKMKDLTAKELDAIVGAQKTAEGASGGSTIPKPILKKSASTEPNDTAKKKADYAAMNKEMASVTGSDGYVSPKNYIKAKNTWAEAGYTRLAFDEAYRGYVNPNIVDQYGLEQKTSDSLPYPPNQ